MLDYWTSLTYITKFSFIGFLITLALGLLSMGLLGACLYYPVSFLFRSYPTLNKWQGDWVWPAVIGVGMAWSLGFVFGGIAWHYLQNQITSIALLSLIYGFILWLWAAVLWYIVISKSLSTH